MCDITPTHMHAYKFTFKLNGGFKILKRPMIWRAVAPIYTWMDLLKCTRFLPQIPFHMEVIKSATDNDSIGSAICKRADQINAAVS